LKRLHAGARRRKFEASSAGFIARGFEGRILPFDEQAAATNGEFGALRDSKDLHADPLDLMIAAVAKDADANLTTRNSGNFSQCGIKSINPWEFKTRKSKRSSSSPKTAFPSLPPVVTWKKALAY
jgi:toxin FitB